MRIERVESGFFKTNTYLAIDESTGEALLVDPAGRWPLIAARIASTGARVVAIVNTHVHFDHVSRNHEARRDTGAPLMVHEAARLDRVSPWALLLRGRPRLSPPADRVLREGDTIDVGTLTFEVIHTPGHSPDGICLRCKKAIFTGDTLFAGAIGRTRHDVDYDRLIASINDKLFILSDDIRLYPGHGPQTTIESERKHNIFVHLRPEQIDELLFGPPRKKARPPEAN